MTTPNISFEFFPPQSLEASWRLWDTVRDLAPMDPKFVSVTYGAGGTTRDLTHDAVGVILKQYGLNVAAHLTCVDATREDTLKIARDYAKVGVTEIVALRGDPPKGSQGFTAHQDGFTSSVELVEALADAGDFHIRVGAYPEPHPEADDLQACVDWLKKKIDAGAHSAITQFFFEADTFLRFRDACEKAGITAPIIPGILPIENWNGVKKFATRCGTSVPAWLEDAFEKAKRDGREDLLSTALCTELCSDLLDEGVQDLHFYTLNKPALTRDVCHALGVTPKVQLQNVA
ncbi:5,10-methylenetetrahydrofolate reductase [Aliiroseovarius sp. xm-m-379]|uniref:methylenetetrahydrofolate reductase [NAD(P)H] n=1 Tax=unclassified Aliiroseovarius TaxID=2623558 RepID=UPI001569DE5D|nr:MULTISPECIES: methylenetetrahydrofolate reductase [NAD(P)H] [unclassified Aliiroseovarius]NRP11413.1 5,10-methylenetetrahydrofolate reductase [Aliiroseovarius sp. xm-d-517]NRP23906.1 5,10-methylenetetrahydrofolate reductase [Aliiroseovarius sp. xm-m-379]NRP28847.1 5,10-methylenetetrahydrofolate reductase [Aliiroseovarius sp. xm-m-314]NRP32705.1 5,10-methylenetetrahydrofolate reductase [Aliiroseovarius sp. xm-a-104]NRP42261.1 5,10-methylenetetrahydrofolate reductase [Aliiroseovarius sp. xm-m